MDLADLLDWSNLGNLVPGKSLSDWLEIGRIFSVCIPHDQISNISSIGPIGPEI